jgi:hypothetical protein
VHVRSVGGLPRQRSTAPAVSQPRFHILDEVDMTSLQSRSILLDAPSSPLPELDWQSA